MSAFWALEVLGHEADLQDLERSLVAGFGPCWVERLGPSGEYCALRGDAFDALDRAELVHTAGQSLVGVLNGAMRVNAGSEPVRAGKVLRVEDDGQIEPFSFASASVRLRGMRLTATASTFDPSTGMPVPASPPERSPVQVWLDLSTTKPDLADLLSFVGRADDWFDLYKGIEIACEIAGGEHALVKLLGESGSDFKAAKTTANWYRHARAHKPEPLVELEAAKAQLHFAARKVFEQALSGGV